jgi:hypothetical protein
MNTEQRRLLRNACYFFAGAAFLAAATTGGDVTVPSGLAGIALAFAGKFIWAGRDAGQPPGK